METCLYCHGTNIKACVEVGQNADGGATGLKFRHR